MKVLFCTDEFYEGLDVEGIAHNGTFDELISDGVVKDSIEFSTGLWTEQKEYFYEQLMDVVKTYETKHNVTVSHFYLRGEESVVLDIADNPLEQEEIEESYKVYVTYDPINMNVSIYAHNKNLTIEIEQDIYFLTKKDMDDIANESPLFSLFGGIKKYIEGKALKFNGGEYFI